MSSSKEHGRDQRGERSTYTSCFPVGQQAATKAFKEFVATAKSPHSEVISEYASIFTLNRTVLDAAQAMISVLKTMGDFDEHLFIAGVALVHRVVRYQAVSNGGSIVRVGPEVVTNVLDKFSERALENLDARTGFLRDSTAIQLSEPFLGNAIEDTARAFELTGPKNADFHGGAWFAYSLLKEADDSKK